jgi:hypothetical protein
MKTTIKKEYIVLGVIIVLLLAYLLFQSRDKVHYKIPKIDPVNKEDIDKVEIKKADQTITLVKKDSQWLLEPQGYPTDGEKLGRIIDTIAQLTLTDLASRAKNYSPYDLGEDKAIHVKAFAKGTLVRDFEIGKMASTYGHTFVKIKDNPNIYYARESFRSHFEMKAGELRDKVVMKLDSNEISEISINKDGKDYLFTKNAPPVEPPVVAKVEKDKEKPGESAVVKPEAEPKKPEAEITWLMPDGKKGKKTQVDSLINQLANLSCQEFIEDKTKEEFKTLEPIYTLKLKGSKDYVITVFPKVEKKAAEGEEGPAEGGYKYPVISSENPYPFYLTSWTAEQLMKKPDELIEAEKPEPDHPAAH